MIPILNSRIQQTDCQMQGFVLDGFPKTSNQIKCLEDLKLNPNLIVAIESTQERMFERVSYRKIDPLTGEMYDSNSNQSPIKLSQEISTRLQTIPLETMEILQNRFKKFKKFRRIEMF